MAAPSLGRRLTSWGSVSQKAWNRAARCTGLQEAKQAYEQSSRGRRQGMVNGMPTYRKIRSNVFTAFVSKKSLKMDDDDVESVCVCKPGTTCDDDCLNRQCKIECVPRTCPAGPSCTNQRFQRQEYEEAAASKPLTVVLVRRRWRRLTATTLWLSTSVRSSTRENASDDCTATRFVALVISMRLRSQGMCTWTPAGAGNIARFINHSCEPNLRVEKWYVKGELRLGIFANMRIEKGTEVTIDYQLGNIADLVGKDKMKCSCGAPSCSGFIGVKLSKAKSKSASKATKASATATAGDGAASGGRVARQTPIRPSWCQALQPGMTCDAMDRAGNWYPARLVQHEQRDGSHWLKIHYKALSVVADR